MLIKKIRLKKIIKKFVKQINPQIKTRFHNYQPESSIKERKIFINLNDFLYTETETDLILIEVLKNKNKYHDNILFPIFVLLHEVGHIEASKKYRDIDCELEKYIFQCSLINIIECEKMKLTFYKNLPLEVDADTYAFNFITNNLDMVERFQNKIYNLIG